MEFNPKTYTMTTGCKGKLINYYDLENFEIVNSMKFNTSEVKEIQFYNKDEFEAVEWGFFGCNDYIRLINCERNEQSKVYGVPHDSIADMKIDLKNDLLTCLCTYKSEMTYWGVKLPALEELDNEVDMQVDEGQNVYQADDNKYAMVNPNIRIFPFVVSCKNKNFVKILVYLHCGTKLL